MDDTLQPLASAGIGMSVTLAGFFVTAAAIVLSQHERTFVRNLAQNGALEKFFRPLWRASFLQVGVLVAAIITIGTGALPWVSFGAGLLCVAMMLVSAVYLFKIVRQTRVLMTLLFLDPTLSSDVLEEHEPVLR